jgi:hypothetical protein
MARITGFILLLLVTDRLIGGTLRRGLDRYYGMDRPATVLCVGHSRTVLGIDDGMLERKLGVPVAKYAFNGANTADRLTMIRQYVSSHPSLKIIVYDVSAFTFTDKALSSNSYQLFYPYLDDPIVTAHIRTRARSIDEIFWRKIFTTLRFDEVTLALSMRGYMGLRANLKAGHVDAEATRERIRRGEVRRMEIDPLNVDLLEQTLDYAQSHSIRVALVYIPTLDVLSNSDRPAHDAVMAKVRSIAARHKGTIFLDYNRGLETNHELFFDPIHMNAAGQAMITGRLAEDLSRALDEDPSRSAAGANDRKAPQWR